MAHKKDHRHTRQINKAFGKFREIREGKFIFRAAIFSLKKDNGDKNLFYNS